MILNIYYLGDLALAATDIQEIVEILLLNPNYQTLSLGSTYIELIIDIFRI